MTLTATSPVFQTLHMTCQPLLRGAAALGLATVLALPAQAADAAAQAARPAVEAASAVTLVTEKAKTSYATGVMTARNLIKNEVEFDLEMLVRGLRDGMAGGAIAMDERELKKVLQTMQTNMQRHMTNERNVKATINRENGVIYQKEFAKKAGAVVLPGNLMYRVVKAGDGDRPDDTSTVVIKFKGATIDGKALDATPEGKTATVKVTELMTGMREALKHMPAGSSWEVVIPPTMAYGSRGTPTIGPNETLVFELELVALVQR
jgi:FKBP-type peptidyl-prolyl cis-trans isomerase FklB